MDRQTDGQTATLVYTKIYIQLDKQTDGQTATLIHTKIDIQFDKIERQKEKDRQKMYFFYKNNCNESSSQSNAFKSNP